jgi:hypothetical protein
VEFLWGFLGIGKSRPWPRSPAAAAKTKSDILTTILIERFLDTKSVKRGNGRSREKERNRVHQSEKLVTGIQGQAQPGLPDANFSTQCIYSYKTRIFVIASIIRLYTVYCFWHKTQIKSPEKLKLNISLINFLKVIWEPSIGAGFFRRQKTSEGSCVIPFLFILLPRLRLCKQLFIRKLRNQDWNQH